MNLIITKTFNNRIRASQRMNPFDSFKQHNQFYSFLLHYLYLSKNNKIICVSCIKQITVTSATLDF